MTLDVYPDIPKILNITNIPGILTIPEIPIIIQISLSLCFQKCMTLGACQCPDILNIPNIPEISAFLTFLTFLTFPLSFKSA